MGGVAGEGGRGDPQKFWSLPTLLVIYFFNQPELPLALLAAGRGWG